MKILERIALILFSIIMLVVSIISCLVIFDILELKIIFEFLENVIENQTVIRIILGFAIVSIILAIKSLFFPSKIKKSQEIRTGILLENKDGRLLISRDTIENLVNSVVKSFTDAVDVQTKVNLDTDNNITVFVSLLVKEETIIKELSANIQNKIKETVKRSTDLDVNQININIKNIENIENQKNGIKIENQTKIKLNNVQINQNQTKENKAEANIVK